MGRRGQPMPRRAAKPGNAGRMKGNERISARVRRSSGAPRVTAPSVAGKWLAMCGNGQRRTSCPFPGSRRILTRIIPSRGSIRARFCAGKPCQQRTHRVATLPQLLHAQAQRRHRRISHLRAVTPAARSCRSHRNDSQRNQRAVTIVVQALSSLGSSRLVATRTLSARPPPRTIGQ